MDLIAEQLLRARHKPNPATTALEKEIERFKYLLKKNSEKNALKEFTAAASFTLLELWNKYIKLVPKDVFNKQIISMGDLLFEKQEYAIAKNLCYQWYLLHCITVNHDGCNVKEKYFSDGFHSNGNINAAVLTFKALMGNAASSFYLIQCKDYKLMDPDHQLIIVKVLSQLRGVTQAGLYYEPLYWLVHNGIVHIYTIAQHLMMCNLSHMVVEYLLWAAVCMESSVPLMAVKFLSLRASIYTAICQCYYDINQSLQAELFARRGLDKVNELARMENMSSEETTDTSELTFRTAVLKLGVMVFKRSVLESRTKNKSILRTKSKPTVKDSIQNCAWPRSATEKLLSEMFNGRAAQFLAVLKALEDHSRRPLYQGPPNPKTELDQDTISDVYHELFCAGTELALSALDASAKEQLEPGGENYLLQLAINGQDVLSVGAIEVFTRLAYNYEQMEVFNMLLDPLDQCVQHNIAHCQMSLSILTEVETLKQQIKATKDSSGKPQIVQLLPLARVLEQAIRKVNDFDLLLDASLLLWKHGSQYYQHIVSSNLSNLRHHEHDQSHTFTPPLNFVQLLVSTQSIFYQLELWKVDVVLYISVCLKLAFLFEGGAQGLQINGTASTVKYDRAKLLDSGTMIEAGLTAINWARCNSSTPKETMELGVIHCELLYTYYRLQVKLASTHLPPPPPSSTTKPSMLKSKVKERQLIEENRKKAMASVTAPDDIVPSWSELVEQCANDQSCHMLLLMAQSSITSDDSVKEKLVKEAEACLLAYQKQRRPQQSVVQKSSSSHSIPPAPELVRYSGTHMVFKPSSFLCDNGAEVCWYKLFGCHAVGSNIKVRLSDHHYPGLGNLVPATEPLVVTGLQPNEMYVFAVAAYSADGKLVGGSIGETSRPLVASHDMPIVVLWGLLAQCAYLCKVNSVALRAAQTLRKHFVTDHQDSILKVKLLESYPTSVTRLYLNSIFIHASVSIEEGCLWCDQVAVAPSSLLSSQQARLQLCTQLLTALEVGQHLNSPSHCLQIVVMMYGLLMPLLQYGLTTKNIARILMYCFSVLQEVPIQLLLHSQSHLHHMVAVISYNLAQLMLTWKEKNVFLNICEATKLLLLATLPLGSPSHPSSAEQGSIPSVNHPLYQQIKGSVVLSEGNTTNTQGNQGGGAHNSLVTTLTTISSIMTSSVPTKKGGVRQRKGRRNNTLGQDTITDEMKSDEIRAIEAFVLSNQGSSHLDDTELTGQEDINLLHTIINVLPLTAAHKEVVKFHRRPHYLSLLVLLLQQAIAEGNYDLVLEWSREARHWLNRRNDLLLTHHLHQHQRPVSTLNKTTKKTLVTTKKSSKVDLNLQPNKIQTIQSKAVMETTTNKHVQQQQHRRMHLAKIEITRDDLTVKARAVLKDRLTTLWKHMCRRRKLREVLSNEMCWRAQFNLCQAVSSFQLLLAKLDKPQQSQNGFDHLISHTALRLDSTMVVISGVIPAQNWIPPPLPTTTEETEGMDSQQEEPRVRPESARIEMKDTDSNLAVALGSSAALLYNRPPRPQSIKTDTPPLREKPKPPGLHWEMQECFTYYQRAIVLAHRKKAWTLLQNASRALWNVINVFCDWLKYSNENDNTLPTLGAMYATSLSSLYFAVDSLLDMVDELPVKLPLGHMTTAQLYYTTDDDDTSTVDGNFIARLGLLSVHVFYANQHWEKLLHCGSRLLQGMSQYTEQILPILLFAQRRLKDRIAYYGPLIRNHTIHPAAHLDPGPTGHNIYGSVGYALILTRFSTDPGHLLDGEPMISGTIPNYQRSVCHCRSLVARYLASAVPALAAQKMYAVISPDPDPPSRKITSAIELCPITADHFYIILEAYSNAIGCLEEQSELCGLKCELMSELGALLMHTGDTKLAAQWWERALIMLVGVADHRLVSAAAVVESSGLWGCLLAGVLAARLAQYVYYNELDNHKIYVDMSAALLKVLLSGNISLPHKDIDFALYNINGVNLLPGLEIFSNPFRSNAHSIANSFQYTCEQLVYSNEHLTELLPLLTTYEYFSYCILCNVHHYVMSVILKVELLTQLNMFSEALMLLWQILTGEHLPVTGIPATTTYRGQPKFDNAKQMSDQRNFRVLATVLDRALPPSLQKLYGEGLVQRVILTQAGLLVKIASTNVTVPHQNILSRAGHCSRPGTTLSDYVPSASGHLASEAPSSAETTSSTTTRCSKGRPSLSHEEIKLLLLEHSEQLICQLCNKLTAKIETEPSCHHLWMLARGHLLLARVSRLYHQPLTAVKICHNIIVLLLRHLHQAKSIVPAWGASPGVGTHLWLLCQLELLDSLTHCHAIPKGWGSCMDILEEGLKGTTACGDDTLANKMKLKSMLYFLKKGEYSSLKKYLPHSPLQGQCNLTNLQMWLMMCDEMSHDPCVNYCQLEELINNMLMERTPSSDVGLRQNAYQHELYLLQAHIGVQLSYEQLFQMEKQSTTSEDECKNIIKRLERVIEMCNLCGGQCITLKGTALFCLAVTWHKLNAEEVMTAEPLHEVASKYIECLLTIQPASIAHVGLVVNCYLALAELFILRSRAAAQISPVTSSQPLSRSGRSPEKDSKESYRDKIVAWNCIKAAAAIKQSYLSLSTITASLHKEEILKTLPDKAIVDLPDFVLMELCGSVSPHQDPLPMESIFPSRQSFSSMELTWLPILNYHCSLHQQFTPTRGLLPNGLPADVITTASQCSNLHHFLSDHLSYYSKSCVIPGIPKVLIPYAISQQSAPSMTGSYTPVGEWEVVILWNPPVFNPEQVMLNGVVSLHHKSSTQQQATIKVFTIRMTSQKLESLLSDWLQLGSQHEQTITESRQGEKASLKSKKKLKQISSSSELEELISQQVNSLLATLSGKNITGIAGKIPTLLPQSVPTIAKLLQPLGQCTANGEDVYKLFYKLSELL